MADSSLDDFFAKKDKSKKKGKSKLTPTDILAKQEEASKKEKKTKKEKQQTTQSSQSSTQDSHTGIIKDDEEWNEFQDEEEKDYSGLRIQNLQISAKEEGTEEEITEETQEEDENGEPKEKRDTGQQGPWNKSNQPNVQAAPVIEEAPKPKVEEEKPKTGGKYVPPGARQAAANPTPTGPTPLRKKKAAPNIQSEEDFPTLMGGGPGGGGSIGGWVVDSDPRSFERVQSGGKQTDDPNQRGPQLSLGNKYAALQD